MLFTGTNDVVDVAEIAARVRRFVDDVATPREVDGFDEHGVREDVRAELQELARAEGLLTPHVAVEHGGLGLDMQGRAAVFIEAGRSLMGPQALNCAAPDEGNMHLLAAVADERQIEQYLLPLVAGKVRSCFAMTEPAPGAGSDPTMLKTTATRIDGGWRIDGHKWFTTGAVGAGFAICMARTRDAIDKDGGATMFLVPMDAPGIEIVRPIPSLDLAAVGAHCEVRFNGVEVPDEDVLGEVDQGFRYAQVRLSPARLTHCMRWLGLAWRAHEMAIERAREREAFGSRLGSLGLVQGLLAESEIDLRTSRLLTLQGCAVIDAGRDARQDSAIAKVYVSEAVGRVVDRSVQIHGALGVSGDSILSRFYSEVRPFRIYDGPSEVHRWAIARRILSAGSTSLMPAPGTAR